MFTLTLRARRRLTAIAAAAIAALLGPAAGMASASGASPAAAQARAPARSAAGTRVVPGGTWGTAIEVPGTAAVNTGGNATVDSVSCAAAGTCSAGGWYDGSSGIQAFVVSQVHGTWAKVKAVPGTATRGPSFVNSLSCASAGNCSAAGNYAGGGKVFVVNQVHGTWGTAKEIPGTGASGFINSVSCASAGNCSADGTYASNAGPEHPLVVSQAGGTWGPAKVIPVGVGPGAGVQSVSCASAGNCSAGGYYDNGARCCLQAFVVSQAGGTWGPAKIVPGTSTGGNSIVNSVSCASAGNCTAGGFHADSTGHNQAFLVSQIRGTWGTAKEVPGTAALNTGGGAGLNSLSCASAGDCSAGGGYTDSSGHGQAFVVSQVGGTWGTAQEVPGTATLNKGGNATINSVSCASAGNCSAAGSYKDSAGHIQAFVVSQVRGTWGTAAEVPGTATLNKGGDATVNWLSCAPAGTCSAGGQYTDSAGHTQAFVVGQG